VGRQLGVDDVHAELHAHEKMAPIESLMAHGKRVAMVGHGITAGLQTLDNLAGPFIGPTASGE
jgi:cation transport ATPase